MKTQTFAAAQWAYDNARPPPDNLLASYLESLTLEDLLAYGDLEGSYGPAWDSPEYKAELDSRPVPENVELLLDTDLDEFGPYLGTVYVYDSNPQTEQLITDYPWWLQHIIPGWTRLTSFRCAETILNDYRNYLLTTENL